MIIRVIYQMLFILAITGCSSMLNMDNLHARDAETSSTLFGEINTAPRIPDDIDLLNDHTALVDYVDNLNWYFNYLFAYVKVVNDFASTRGYTPPNTSPICKLINSPALNPIPTFTPAHSDVDEYGFERDLTDYIVKLKGIAKDDRKDLEELKKYQQYLCIY